MFVCHSGGTIMGLTVFLSKVNITGHSGDVDFWVLGKILS